MQKTMSPSKKEMQNLLKVALGDQKADLAIVNGDLVNVYTGELLHDWSVAVKGDRIAYVGDNAGHTIGPETKVIDASGKIIIPGLVDSHTHLLYLYHPSEFIKHAMPGGTTTIITETMEIAFPLGIQGIVDFLDLTKEQPIKMFATAPPMSTISPTAEKLAIDAKTLRKLLKREDILGLGETYWSSLFDGNDRIFGLFAETLAAGKKLEGHSAGARGNRLISYIATGISSCHESTTVEEALERLRLGVYTMIREGDIRMELPVISKIKDQEIDFRRLVLTTDGIGPQRLMTDGYMEFVLQRAIDFGFAPITAIQMATLNAAEHFHIDHFVGGIAPGKFADIVIIPDLKTIRAEYVISNGNIVAKNNKLLVLPRKSNFPKRNFRSIDIHRKLKPADFNIRVGTESKQVKVRVMDMVTDLVTREAKLDIATTDGEINIDKDKDILKIAVITTDNKKEKIFTGLVKGFGIGKGALATSAVWDNCALLVVGADEKDMAGAVNRLIALKGGIVVCADGKVEAELSLPFGGILSDQPIETIVRDMNLLQEKMVDLGCSFPDAHMSLTIFSGPAIPFLRISEEGLVDTRKGITVDLIVPE